MPDRAAGTSLMSLDMSEAFPESSFDMLESFGQVPDSCSLLGCSRFKPHATTVCKMCEARSGRTAEEIREEAGTMVTEIYDCAADPTAMLTACQITEEWKVAGEIGILITDRGVTSLDRHKFQTAARLQIAIAMRRTVVDIEDEKHCQWWSSCHSCLQFVCRSCQHHVCSKCLPEGATACRICQALLSQVMHLHAYLSECRSVQVSSSSSAGD